MMMSVVVLALTPMMNWMSSWASRSMPLTAASSPEAPFGHTHKEYTQKLYKIDHTFNRPH